MKRYHSNILLFVLIGVLVVFAGCCINIGGWPQAKAERSEQLAAPMADVEQLAVDTSFGKVVVTGAETTECSVAAHITANAPTAQEANEIAHNVEIRLEQQGKTLVVRTMKPHLAHNRSIGVDFDITIPHKTGIECSSSFGEIAFKDIEGEIKGHTSFGAVRMNNVTGKIDVDTSYGAITGRQVTSSDFIANTSFGEIDVDFTESCPANMSAKLDTSYGAIRASIPKNFAGGINLETGFGEIETSMPVTVQGRISKDHIKGAIGQGEGKLVLKTSFGDIKLK